MAIRGHPRSRTVTPETPPDQGEHALNCTDVIPEVTVRIPPRPLVQFQLRLRLGGVLRDARKRGIATRHQSRP